MYGSVQQAFLGRKRNRGKEENERKRICVLFAAIMLSILSTGTAVEDWKEKAVSGLESVLERKAEASFTPKVAGADIAMTVEEKASLQSILPEIPIIVVDVGHGGEDEGCSREGVNEKDINLAIAQMVEEKLVTSQYQEQLAQGIAQAVEYYYHPKTMYLTFDDGPFVENTGRVLDILEKRGIKATFFLVGEYVERNPDMARRIVEEGHSIGIHCYRHDYETLYASTDSYIADFERAHQLVLEVTGVDCKMFRFPGGSINSYNQEVKDGIIQEMTERGYIYYDWNASLEELLDHFPEYQMLALTEEVKPIQF